MSTATLHDYAAVGLPRDEEGPVFDKPWQAKAFSLIVHLHRAGLFPWAEWVRTFSEAIKAAPAQPAPAPVAAAPAGGSYEGAREQIQELLYKQKFDKIFQEYIENLRSKAVIEVKL